ncbi:MAG: PQQ-binding-like beta-propeller repeat protein [Vicinamibacterales bacterium]
MSRTRVTFVCVLVLSVVAWPAAATDHPLTPVWPVDAGWPMNFQAVDTLSLVMTESRVLVVEPAQISARAWSDGAPLWKSELAATARPVADEGRVFVPAADAIHALSDTSGTEQWRLPGRVTLSPTARAGWLIVPTGDGSLQGVSTTQGQEVWRIALPSPLTTSVAIDGDLVIGACVDGSIRAWQITDGAMRWARELGTRPSQLLTGRGDVFVAGEDGRLMSVRQRDGRLNWAYSYNMPIAGRLAVDDRHIYATTIDNSVHAHSFNGHQTWHKLLAFRVVDGMFSDSGSVFVPQSNGEIRMYLAKDGTRAGRLNSSPQGATVVGGLVVGGSGDQLRMAVTASAASGIALTTYRRTGLAAVPAKAAPRGTPLLLTLPGGRP